jgi:hypothetical protein
VTLLSVWGGAEVGDGETAWARSCRSSFCGRPAEPVASVPRRLVELEEVIPSASGEIHS